MRNQLEMISEWSDFSFLIVGSLDEKESENQKSSKFVENHRLNLFWRDKSIGNGFRMIGFLILIFPRQRWVHSAISYQLYKWFQEIRSVSFGTQKMKQFLIELADFRIEKAKIQNRITL